MTIITDFELMEGYEFSEKGNLIIDEIKNFVTQRLKVLEDEINAEDGRIILAMLHTPTGIHLEGFSEQLIEKITYSLSNDDFRYFLAKMNL